LRKAGILIIIILFIASGTLALLSTRSAEEAACPEGELPAAEEQQEIEVAPAQPAVGEEQPARLELSFHLDNELVESGPVVLTPRRQVRDICYVGREGSLHFLFGAARLEEVEEGSWQELFYMWNHDEEQTLLFSVAAEKKPPPFLRLGVGSPREILSFEDDGSSGSVFELAPGSGLPVSASFTSAVSRDGLLSAGEKLLFYVSIEEMD